jgi:alpha-ketoglutarate-dependent taurine dioxygenase
MRTSFARLVGVARRSAQGLRSLRHSSTKAAVSAGLHAEGTAVSVKLGDGTSAKFHSLWLRDHCRCAACTHETTLQRLVDTLAIPSNIKAQGVEVIENGAAVRVHWTDGPGIEQAKGETEHKSVFSSAWLAAHVYPHPPPSELPTTVAAPHAPAAVVKSDQAAPIVQRKPYEDPAAIDPLTVTPWTAQHFGSRHAPDTSRYFPSVPYNLYSGEASSEEINSFISNIPVYQSQRRQIEEALASAKDAENLKRSLGLHRALSLLQRYGFVRIEGVPPTEKATEQVCKRIGPLMSTLYSFEQDKKITGDEGKETTLSRHMWRTEVLPDGGNDTAYTGIALPAHTDGCYMLDVPGLQVFHALKSDPERGGDSLLVDGLSVAEHLRKHHPDTFAFLCNYQLPYHHTDPEHILYAQHSVIQLDKNMGRVTGLRFNNDDRAPLVFGGRDSSAGGSSTFPVPMPTVYQHLRRLIETMRMPQHELWMPLRPGTVLIFNNQRVMHGRASFSIKSGRVLSGAYLAADTWTSRLRAVSASLGLYKPALAL